MNVWQSPSFDASYNLALEACVFELLKKTEVPFFPLALLWRSKPSIVLGRNQNLYQEVAVLQAEEQQIAIQRRHTGGGTVYHDLGNLNFTFFLSDDSHHRLDYSYYLQPIIQFLATHGVKAELRNQSDVFVDGKKCSGNAQQRSKSKALHHGTLLFDTDLSNLNGLLCVEKNGFVCQAVPSRPSPVRNLKEYLPFNEVEQFQLALVDFLGNGASFSGLSDGTNCDMTYSLEQFIVDFGSEIAEKKQECERFEWVFGKSPPFKWHYNTEPYANVAAQLGLAQGELSLEVCNGHIITATIPGQDELSRRLQNKPYLPSTISELADKQLLPFLFAKSGLAPH